MPVNPSPQYQKAEIEYTLANTIEEKLVALRKMLQLVPKHKGSEKLVADIKKRIAKWLKEQERQKVQAKKVGRTQGIKKQGAARICIIGSPNSGKSTLLTSITNAKPQIEEYPFTTKKPEIGTLDYEGIKIQVIEIPSFVKDYLKTEKGPVFLAIVKEANLLIITYKDEQEKELVFDELKKAKINLPFVEFNFSKLEKAKDKKPKPEKIKVERAEEIKEKIWKKLNLIKVYTKQPHKEKALPPIALKKSSTVMDLAKKVHKDFVKNFKYAKVFGNSVRFQGQQVGPNHVLADNDVVELHMKE